MTRWTRCCLEKMSPGFITLGRADISLGLSLGHNILVSTRNMSVYELVMDFVKLTVLDLDNIEKYYDTENSCDYKHKLFNENCTVDIYHRFEEYVEENGGDINKIFYRVIVPAVFEYAEENNIPTKKITKWINEGDDYQLLNMYAVSITDEIIEEDF